MNTKEYVEDAARELEKVAADLRNGAAIIKRVSVHDYSRLGEYRCHQISLTISDAKACDVEVSLPAIRDERRR